VGVGALALAKLADSNAKLIQSLNAVCVLLQDMLENRKNSCEVYGYDLMLDEDLNIWLLEVNASPDMCVCVCVCAIVCACAFVCVLTYFTPYSRSVCTHVTASRSSMRTHI